MNRRCADAADRPIEPFPPLKPWKKRQLVPMLQFLGSTKDMRKTPDVSSVKFLRYCTMRLRRVGGTSPPLLHCCLAYRVLKVYSKLLRVRCGSRTSNAEVNYLPVACFPFSGHLGLNLRARPDTSCMRTSKNPWRCHWLFEGKDSGFEKVPLKAWLVTNR